MQILMPQDLQATSFASGALTKIQNMGLNPIVNLSNNQGTLRGAFFVSGDTGISQTGLISYTPILFASITSFD